MKQSTDFEELLNRVKACTHCKANLAHKARPVVQLDPRAKILIAGQAPGSKVHETGVPFDDPSGDRLRRWMGIDKATFYDPTKIAILPMGFCYPGKGKSGDLPPRPECADLWRKELLAHLPNIELTLVIGKYAIDWHLPQSKGQSLTETVRDWKTYWPEILPLPHPSPRNNIWLKKNEWFESDVAEILGQRVKSLLHPPSNELRRAPLTMAE